MDGPALQSLLQRSQSPEMIDAFGLAQFGDTLELSSGSQKNETDANLLAKVEAVVGYLEELLAAGAVSIGKSPLRTPSLLPVLLTQSRLC